MASSSPTSRGGIRQTPGAQTKQLSWNQTSFFSPLLVGSIGVVVVISSTLTVGSTFTDTSVLVAAVFFFSGDFFPFFPPNDVSASLSGTLRLGSCGSASTCVSFKYVRPKLSFHT